MVTYNTIALLKAAAPPANGTAADVLGYYAPGDGGDGQFTFVSSSTKADNGGTYIAPTSGTGRWHRTIDNGTMSAKAWGAHIDNVTDDKPRLQAALDFMAKDTNFELYLPPGHYDIRSQLSYVTDDNAVGPRIRGAGHRPEGANSPVGTALHWRFTGASLLRISGSEPQLFNEGGYLQDFGIDSVPRPGDPELPRNSQAAAIELSNWWLFSFRSVSIKNTHGHGIWAPSRFTAIDVSVTDGGAPLSGADQRRPNDKPYAWVENTGGRRGSMAEILAHVKNQPGAADDGKIQGFLIRRPGFGYRVNDPVRVTGTGSGFSGRVSSVDANDGITGIEVIAGGTGYDRDVLFNNEDAFTVAGFTFDELIIVGNDGWGISMPHFASGGHMFNCYIVGNGMHGVIVGASSTHVIGGAVASNGVHPNAGFFPGIWVRRGYSTPNTFKAQAVEMDSNGYAHIAFDGCSGGVVEDCRMNSWVTIRPEIVPRIGQIPQSQVKFDIGNYRVANNGIHLNRCVHRAQPNDGTVPTSPVATTSGNTTVTFTVDPQPNAIFDFYPGVTVKIVKSDNSLVPFANGTNFAKVVSVNYNTDAMVLDSAPTQTLAIGANAVIKEAIGDNNYNWYDFGRTIANAGIKVTSPVASQQPAVYTKFANLDEAQTFALVDIQDLTLERPHMVGGNNTSLSRIPLNAVVSLPIGETAAYLDVPFTQVLFDPWKRIELGAGNAPTGRYIVRSSGAFQVSGTLALRGTEPGDIVQIAVNHQTVTLKVTDGTPDIKNAIAADFRRICTGDVTDYAESFTFEANVAAIVRETYIGVIAPPPTSGTSDDDLLWFNPQTRVLKIRSGTTWTVVPNHSNLFQPKVFLSVQVRMRTALNPSVTLDTTSAGLNTVTFNQIH